MYNIIYIIFTENTKRTLSYFNINYSFHTGDYSIISVYISSDLKGQGQNVCPMCGIVLIKWGIIFILPVNKAWRSRFAFYKD